MPVSVLSIDPGVTTGYCFARLSQDKIQIHPHQGAHTVKQFWNHLESIQPSLVIMEDFTYRRTQTKVILYPVQLIGVATLWCSFNDVRLTLQTPAVGKAFYTDEQLKRVGAYKRGMKHALDATRHLFQWVTFAGGFQYTSDVEKATVEFITP